MEGGKERIFHRQELAKRLVDEMMSWDGSSGLFVAAPRRTGKSTFIREDLIPILTRNRGAEVVYVDLWADPAANPGDVIVDAIKNRLLELDGAILKAARTAGLDKLKIGGLELSIERVGLGKGETLAKALTALAKASGKPVVMVIDEAQHALTTEDGTKALFALKAARDAMNAGGGPGFRLLATGSNADKLNFLVDDKNQAFYQAPMIPLPLLDQSYLKWVQSGLKFNPAPSLNALNQAFQMCDHRPEPLRNVLKDLKFRIGMDAQQVDDALVRLMGDNLARVRQAFIQQVSALRPLDAAVLKWMAALENKFAPYSKEAFAGYRSLVELVNGDDKSQVDQSAVQTSLERLRSENFVWRSGRGVYAIEDMRHLTWLKEMAAEETVKAETANIRAPRVAAAKPAGKTRKLAANSRKR